MLSNSDGFDLSLESQEQILPGMTEQMLKALAGSLIVSCQASGNHPMRNTDAIVRMASSALLGGASALRINSPPDVRAVRAITDVPIIGLDKEPGRMRNVITVRPDQAAVLAAAGANIVAVDATSEVTDDIQGHLRQAGIAAGVPIMADVSTLEEGLMAWDSGVGLVGTTLSGYTPYTLRGDLRPDIELVAALSSRGVRVIAEGRYVTPAEVRGAFDAGAFAVVVGGAITDPVAITRRFVAATTRQQ
ncbi:N-acetylmannosamine-6-phosphate 2-epimerase [Luethyella okanaganae]|uniref:N-acylglucosamine-6-phosphate 2-epimerase n=1 Tax=Luethyella okanaganae TaxID=69372 RepID=A0ABW1VGN9_9MICO